MIDVRQYVNYLVKHQINDKMFILCYLIYLKDSKLLNEYKALIKKYDGIVLTEQQKDLLVRKGFLVRNGKNYSVGAVFKSIINDKNKNVSKFYNLYPSFAVGKDKTYPLKGVDFSIIAEIYNSVVGVLDTDSEELLKDIEYGIENNIVFGRIDKFLTTKQFLEIRKLRKGNPQTVTKDDDDEKDF